MCSGSFRRVAGSTPGYYLAICPECNQRVHVNGDAGVLLAHVKPKETA